MDEAGQRAGVARELEEWLGRLALRSNFMYHMRIPSRFSLSATHVDILPNEGTPSKIPVP